MDPKARKKMKIKHFGARSAPEDLGICGAKAQEYKGK